MTVTGATTQGRDGMPGCVDWTDEGKPSVICVFETTEGGNGLFMIKKVLSYDDGKTWGGRDLVYKATGGNGGTLWNFCIRMLGDFFDGGLMKPELHKYKSRRLHMVPLLSRS